MLSTNDVNKNNAAISFIFLFIFYCFFYSWRKSKVPSQLTEPIQLKKHPRLAL